MRVQGSGVQDGVRLGQVVYVILLVATLIHIFFSHVASVILIHSYEIPFYESYTDTMT